jgi:hypothetical protein
MTQAKRAAPFGDWPGARAQEGHTAAEVGHRRRRGEDGRRMVIRGGLKRVAVGHFSSEWTFGFCKKCQIGPSR